MRISQNRNKILENSGKKKRRSNEFSQNRRYCDLKNFETFATNTIIFRICQFLSKIHQKIFENDSIIDQIDKKKMKNSNEFLNVKNFLKN